MSNEILVAMMGLMLLLVVFSYWHQYQMHMQVKQLQDLAMHHKHRAEAAEVFSYLVSHDLRMPLIKIRNRIRQIRHTQSLDSKLEAQLHDIHHTLDAADEMVRKMLDLHRLGQEGAILSEFEMGYLIQKTYEEVKEATQFAGSISIEPMPLVKADRVLIKQVWQNLLSNAIKFSAGEAKPHLAVRVEPTDSGYFFWLQDNGIGIPSAEYHKVFEPFHHSDHGFNHGYSLEGYGLGLAIVKRIVEKHGGEVWAESLPKGIQFGFSLPASRVQENKSLFPK